MLSLQRILCARFPACCSSVPRNIFHREEVSHRNFTKTIDDATLPLKPKKPPSPFLKFLAESRNTIKKEYPDASFRDIQKIAAEKWRLSSPELKKPFVDQYKKEKENYFFILNSYESNLTEDQKAVIEETEAAAVKKREKRRLKKGLIELGKPKRPPGPFALFFATKKGMKIPGETKQEWATRIASEWKNMPEIEKKLFVDQFEVLRIQYDKKIDLWRKEAVKVESENPLVKKAQKKVIQDEERHRERLLKQESGKNRKE